MTKLKLKIARTRKKAETSAPPQPKERRKNPRVEAGIKAQARVQDQPFHEVAVQNIGAGGMCLLMDRKVSPKMILELEFRLPEGSKDLIHTYAEVIWQSNSHTGVKFISL